MARRITAKEVLEGILAIDSDDSGDESEAESTGGPEPQAESQQSSSEEEEEAEEPQLNATMVGQRLHTMAASRKGKLRMGKCSECVY